MSIILPQNLEPLPLGVEPKAPESEEKIRLNSPTPIASALTVWTQIIGYDVANMLAIQINAINFLIFFRNISAPPFHSYIFYKNDTKNRIHDNYTKGEF